MNICSDGRVSQSIVPDYRNTDVEVVRVALRHHFDFTTRMVDPLSSSEYVGAVAGVR